MRESVKRATPASNRVGWPVLTMYIVERFPFLSIWTYHIAYVPLKKKNFIYKWRGTYYSFSYNLALGISKILTLRLALRLFGKSSNNGSAVYIVLATWDRMNCCTSTTWARVEGRGRVLHTEQNEWIYTLKYIYIHQCLEYVLVVHIEIY